MSNLFARPSRLSRRRSRTLVPVCTLLEGRKLLSDFGIDPGLDAPPVQDAPDPAPDFAPDPGPDLNSGPDLSTDPGVDPAPDFPMLSDYTPPVPVLDSPPVLSPDPVPAPNMGPAVPPPASPFGAPTVGIPRSPTFSEYISDFYYWATGTGGPAAPYIQIMPADANGNPIMPQGPMWDNPFLGY